MKILTLILGLIMFLGLITGIIGTILFVIKLNLITSQIAAIGWFCYYVFGWILNKIDTTP